MSATLAPSVPNLETGTNGDWFEFVYLRDNPRGLHDELWHHSSGCRRVIKVRRDVVTHEIIATGVPSDSLSKSAS